MSESPVIELIDPRVAEIFRRMTPAQRLAQAADLWEFANRVMRASILRDHPAWGETEIRREVHRRLHGAESP
jgi:hypothetical protein